MKSLLSVGLALAGAAPLRGEIHAQAVEYKDGDTILEGWVAYDNNSSARRPGVLVVHQWKGLTDLEQKRAEMLAQLGYVAFCADIYGKGIRPATPQEAGAVAGKYRNDRALLRRRVNAALAALRQQAVVDSSRVAAIGYCFGGTTVLELARSGAEVSGVVSFHGGLDSPNPADGKNIRCPVLILHGAEDPFVTQANIDACLKELRDAKVDWQMISYSGAVHAFTDWHAKGDSMPGAAYNEKADHRSWEAMKQFFDEIFKSSQ